MSFRLFTNRLLKNGQYLLRNYYKRNIHSNILDNSKNKRALAPRKAIVTTIKPPIQPQNGFLRIGQHARKLFVDNILNRVTTTYSTELRAQATKKFLYGDSQPFFALVGISLASGTGVLTKDDEIEGVCWEIRDAVSRIQNFWNEHNISLDKNFGVEDLNIGQPIAKGCSAVVYEATVKNYANIKTKDKCIDQINLNNYDFNTIKISKNPLLLNNTLSKSLNNLNIFMDCKIPSVSSNQNNGNVNDENNKNMNKDKDDNLYKYPLALKMMFNYDIQSNSMNILRAMYKETIPAQRYNNKDIDNWEKALLEQTINLPPHPNIVLMFGVFCSQIPNDLILSTQLYPMALPPRINPNGYGRNMSLFLLMKRYNCSLSDYLTEKTIDMRTSLLLFTQLLEAVAHLKRNNVAHRDLKSDNILIEIKDNCQPILVLSDFGCCLADKKHGLNMPYNSYDTDKGGNTALMAPEIISKEPGTFSVLNYKKSDLWACGTIAYEIFGMSNPFYVNNNNKQQLKNTTYTKSDLPKLTNNIPFIVRSLIFNLLEKNPNKRLSSEIAANVMQLFLWAPSSWLNNKSLNPSSSEILEWLLSLTTKVLCENPTLNGNKDNTYFGCKKYTEYLLITCFLARAKLQKIRYALDWIQNLSLV